jgi:exocyst complex component 4
VSSYQELAGTVLLGLHMEIRMQIIQALSVALSPTTAPYLLEQVVNDPDPRILALNADLVSYDETTSRYLRAKELAFLRTGLAQLIDTFLITNAGMVKAMNANGCGRMELNILVLQQNLKNIEPDVDLARAAAYYDLFAEGAEVIIRRAKEIKVDGEGEGGGQGQKEGFGYEELKTLLELCYSERIEDPERGVSTVARRELGDAALRLSEVMWQS